MKKHIKKKRYSQYSKYVLTTILIFIFICIFISILKYTNIGKNYVLKINNEHIYKEEFLLYLYEQERIFEEIGGVDIWDTNFDGISAKDVLINNAINSISVLKAVVYQSKNLGIHITDEEEKIYKQEATFLQKIIKKEKGVDVSYNICQKFEKEKLIEQKVYDFITSSFVVDDKDFEKYFNEYIIKNKDKFKNINLDYILVKNSKNINSKKIAKEICKQISFNTDFSIFKKEPNIEVYKNINLEAGLFEPNIEEKIYKLREKSISNVIQGVDGFYIFKINKIVNSNIKDIENIAKKEYINNKKAEIYTNEIKDWVFNIKIQKNNEILNNM